MKDSSNSLHLRHISIFLANILQELQKKPNTDGKTSEPYKLVCVNSWDDTTASPPAGKQWEIVSWYALLESEAMANVAIFTKINGVDYGIFSKTVVNPIAGQFYSAPFEGFPTLPFDDRFTFAFNDDAVHVSTIFATFKETTKTNPPTINKYA